MKALEIYQQDLATRESGGDMMERQQYYILLRDALHDELMRDGACELLDRLYLSYRTGEMTKLYVVDYAALMECHSMIVGGRELRDASVHIPHLSLRGEKASWHMLDLPGAHMVPFTREIYGSLRELRSVSRQMIGARESSFAGDGEGASRQEVESVHALNKLLDERCQALVRERDALQARVRELEEGVISEQVSFAIEAQRVREEEALQALYARRRQEAEEVFRTEYARLLEQRGDRRLEDDRARAALLAEEAAQRQAVRQELAREVQQLQETLHQHIARWESGLTQGECRMLARSYTGLHSLLTDGMARVLLECGTNGAAAPVMEALTELQQQLHEQLLRLEQAMLRLGLTVLRPAQGDAYDPRLHAGPEIAQDGLVERCVCPGVVYAATGEALEKAVVSLG